MQRIVQFILPFFFVSCNNGSTTILEHKLTSADSTEIVDVIIDSLRAEMFTQWFMVKEEDKLLCYEPPDFNPELLIEINSKNEILVNGKPNPKCISELVLDFYLANINSNETNNNFCEYESLTEKYLVAKIRELEAELQNIKKFNNEISDIIEFKQNIIDEWKRKLKVLNDLGVDKIQEPKYLAGVEFKYPENCKLYDSVLDSILLGYYKIREMDSKKYYSQSYANIYWNAVRFDDSIAIRKLDAFKLLHPVRILDYRKSRHTPKVEIVLPPLSK